MKDPRIKAKVVHSQSKDAWNVVSTSLCKKYKLARVPYIVLKNNEEINKIKKQEALEIAEFISFAFNNSAKLLKE